MCRAEAITDLDHGVSKNQPMKSLLPHFVHSCNLATGVERKQSDFCCQEEVGNVSSISLETSMKLLLYCKHP